MIIRLTKTKYIFLTQFYFCITEIFKANIWNRFLRTKSPFEFVFKCCEFTKFIINASIWLQNNHCEYLNTHQQIQLLTWGSYSNKYLVFWPTPIGKHSTQLILKSSYLIFYDLCITKVWDTETITLKPKDMVKVFFYYTSCIFRRVVIRIVIPLLYSLKGSH